jgi:hypothetical protein
MHAAFQKQLRRWGAPRIQIWAKEHWAGSLTLNPLLCKRSTKVSDRIILLPECAGHASSPDFVIPVFKQLRLDPRLECVDTNTAPPRRARFSLPASLEEEGHQHGQSPTAHHFAHQRYLGSPPRDALPVHDDQGDREPILLAQHGRPSTLTQHGHAVPYLHPAALQVRCCDDGLSYQMPPAQSRVPFLTARLLSVHNQRPFLSLLEERQARIPRYAWIAAWAYSVSHQAV